VSVQGNVAVASGAVSDANDASYVGLSFLFAVMDNGEGAKAPADQISLTRFDVAHTFADCTAFHRSYFTAITFPIEAGNVQVH